MLVQELWGVLEGGACDHRIIAPRAHPLDPMDRTSHKVGMEGGEGEREGSKREEREGRKRGGDT